MINSLPPPPKNNKKKKTISSVDLCKTASLEQSFSFQLLQVMYRKVQPGHEWKLNVKHATFSKKEYDKKKKNSDIKVTLFF